MLILRIKEKKKKRAITNQIFANGIKFRYKNNKLLKCVKQNYSLMKTFI